MKSKFFAAFLSCSILSTMGLAKPKIEPRLWDDLSLQEALGSKQLAKLVSEPKPILSKGKKGKRQISSTTDELSLDYKAGEKFLLIRDPQVLETLEAKGFHFYSHFDDNSNFESLDQFYKSNGDYKFLADTVKSDLTELATEENQNKTLPTLGVGMRFSRRLFDANWFLSPYARFELVGIINRLDRVSFDSGTCGETRFIYRMAYTSKMKTYSRLPVTVMVKYDNSGNAKENWESCKEYASKWVYPKSISSNQQLVNWLINSGPLQSRLRVSTPKSFELNLQAMRIPSKARADLAGHGTHLMRSFAYDRNGSLRPGLLENTPDVDKINADPRIKVAFVNQFKDKHFIDRLSEGILKIDKQYLASRAWSYSPYGIARRENRLFDQFLSVDDFKGVQFDPSSYVRNAQAAIMRLNDYSCVGCHQARAHAGFHFLGIDKKSTHPLNSLFFEGSGHFEIELKRRSEYMNRVLSGIVPNPKRDFSFAPGAALSGKGHFCGLNEGPFSHWKCEEGLTCQGIDEAEGQKILGKCFPKASMSGDPVLTGSIKQVNHQIDKLVVTNKKACGSLDTKHSFGMFDNSGGFPSGICYRRGCDGIQAQDKNEVCGDGAGSGFNECIAQIATGQISFTTCLEKTANHLGLSRCDQEHSCRNDFVCARSIKGEGYCTPSSFLFQVRVDGHVDPLRGM